MPIFGVSLDLDDVVGLLGMGKVINREVHAAARDLTAMSKARALELAGQRLHSRRQMFVDALHIEQVDAGTWYLQLDASAGWIEQGMSAHSMLPALLASPKAKTAKDGSKFVIVPFRHGPAQNAPASQQPMVQAVRQAMKSRGIPFGKVERDASGRALVGRLHSFDVDAPDKTGQGPGQGWGPVGDVRQGPNARQAVGGGPGGGGTPFLSRVGVYQRQTEGGGVRRDIMTWRIASEKHQGQGRWEHPGVEGAHVLLDTFTWLEQTWTSEVLPDLMDRIIKAI